MKTLPLILSAWKLHLQTAAIWHKPKEEIICDLCRHFLRGSNFLSDFLFLKLYNFLKKIVCK